MSNENETKKQEENQSKGQTLSFGTNFKVSPQTQNPIVENFSTPKTEVIDYDKIKSLIQSVVKDELQKTNRGEGVLPPTPPPTPPLKPIEPNENEVVKPIEKPNKEEPKKEEEKEKIKIIYIPSEQNPNTIFTRNIEKVLFRCIYPNDWEVGSLLKTLELFLNWKNPTQRILVTPYELFIRKGIFSLKKRKQEFYVKQGWNIKIEK